MDQPYGGGIGWRHVRRAYAAAPRRAVARRLAWLAGAVALFVLGAAVAVVAGRPHVAWTLRASDNRLTLTVAEGRGPLAGWLRSTAAIAVGTHRGGSVTLALPPGRTSVLQPVLSSVWRTSERVAVHVPARPDLAASTVDATSMTLRFSLPVATLNAPCGLSPSAMTVTTATIPRGVSACSASLEVLASTGERNRIPLTVPALPPPPPPPPLPPAASGPPTEVFTANPNGGAFYITIDDGWYPSNDVLDLMRSTHVPITAFLVSQAAAQHLDYWRAFLAAGGDIQDHTVSHPYMTKLKEGDVEAQWSVAAQSLKAWLGVTPTMGRPPYGEVNAMVIAAAGRAGLHHVVMWSGVMLRGQLTTQDKLPLRAGQIILLHWTPEVYTDLQRLLALAAAQGLHPASLASALG